MDDVAGVTCFLDQTFPGAIRGNREAQGPKMRPPVTVDRQLAPLRAGQPPRLLGGLGKCLGSQLPQHFFAHGAVFDINGTVFHFFVPISSSQNNDRIKKINFY
ncbi:hypothetical protein [Roseibium aquae]|uniref:hypothetical protein n=1 Tax=Roseibium aquae TaxID=1323746 RepID=UPI0015620C99|nr:hypothetical protein [Roseibium aquae]